MTELLYLKDSYLEDFEAIVTAVEGCNVVLDRTAFYPESGGQLDDRGKLVRLSDSKVFYVLAVRKLGPQVLHSVDCEGLQVGDKVHGWLDWPRRYKMMRMHTATHVLAAVIHNEIGALITGNQLDLDKGRIDFNGAEVKEKYKEFEVKANELLAKGLNVEVKFLSYNEAMKIPSVVKLAKILPPSIPELRIVSIGNIDVQADGGTHVKNTKECGQIEIIQFENKGANRKRLYFILK
ncbi:MAG: alanyl-tRNA editing protein [Candidatus Nanoarchaeia archaeon]